MTVTAENLGGGGSTFPPKGTQVPDFFDDFNRPNLDSLGTQWANWWLESDVSATGTPPEFMADGTRPGPFDCALNPSILDNQCTYWTRNSGIAWTISSPWPLAWMSQGFFDQYVECDVTDVKNTGAIWMVTCFSGNPGSYIGPSGAYMAGVQLSGGGIAYLGPLLRVHFGYNPSATFPLPLGGLAYYFLPYGLQNQNPTILRSGSQQPIIPPVRSVPGLPMHVRMEARHSDIGWTLTLFSNGENIGSAIDNNIGFGLPGLGANQIHMPEDELPNLGSVDNFKAGWLR